MSQASHVFREIISSDRSALGNQFGRPGPGDLREFYDGQPVLADDESQQLSKDHGKSNLPLDLNPGPPMLGRTNRI